MILGASYVTTIRATIVAAIAFLSRDNHSDRLPETVEHLIPMLAEADRLLLLSSPAFVFVPNTPTQTDIEAFSRAMATPGPPGVISWFKDDLSFPAPAPLVEPPGVLCYVKDGCAFFTTAPLDEQWGDDWNDAPYEHNAGTPYPADGVTLTCIRFECGRLSVAGADDRNSPWSVEAINRGETAWLSTLPPPWNRGDEQIRIMAGASFTEFQTALLVAGGTALAPWPSSYAPRLVHPGAAS